MNSGDQRDREAGHRDPLRGFAGAPPARSALTLRLVLAVFGLISCTAGAIAFALAGVPVGYIVAFGVIALAAAVDIAVILRRKRQERAGSWDVR